MALLHPRGGRPPSAHPWIRAWLHKNVPDRFFFLLLKVSGRRRLSRAECSIQSHVNRNMRSVPFQRLKLASFGIYAGDMDMDRCWEVTSMVYTNIKTFPRSSGVNDLWWRHAIFRDFMPPGVIWCADFGFGIRLPFICVEMGSFGSLNTPKEKWQFLRKLIFLNFDPQNSP